jgi:hypothetical protein
MMGASSLPEASCMNWSSVGATMMIVSKPTSNLASLHRSSKHMKKRRVLD